MGGGRCVGSDVYNSNCVLFPLVCACTDDCWLQAQLSILDRLQKSHSKSAALFGGFAQNSFQGIVEIASHLGHALIAILAKERRWLIIFENSPALLVLKQNYPQRRVECSGELMAGHL